MRNYTLAAIALILTLHVNSQVQQSWAYRFLNVAAELGRAITTDNSGNVYVAYGISFSGGATDVRVSKYNSAGTNIWTSTYNGPAGGADIASAIRVDASGNVYVTGRVGAANGRSDILTFKLNSLGVMQWVRSYNGVNNNNDYGNAIALDLSGNVYVTGTTSITDFSPNFVTIKYSNAGTQLWVRTYQNIAGGGDFARRIGIDNTGNVYVGGSSTDASGLFDFTLVKYNSAGTQLFVSRYNGPAGGSDDMKDMVVDALGNCYMAGSVNELSSSSIDLAAVKFNSNGALVWARTYNGLTSGTDYANSVTLDPTGNVIVAGTAAAKGGNNFITIKYNSDGVSQWAASYDGGALRADIAKMVRTDGSGNIYVTGSAVPSGTTLSNIATVKYSSAGTGVWAVQYSLPSTVDGATHLAVYSSSGPFFRPASVYVLGQTTTNATIFDLLLIKYDQPLVIGLAQAVDDLPGQFAVNNFPNPFRGSTTISYSIPEDAYVSIKVYDAVGREVRQLVSGRKAAGNYTVLLTAGKLSAGVYNYRLTATTGSKEFIRSKTIVLER